MHKENAIMMLLPPIRIWKSQLNGKMKHLYAKAANAHYVVGVLYNTPIWVV